MRRLVLLSLCASLFSTRAFAQAPAPEAPPPAAAATPAATSAPTPEAAPPPAPAASEPSSETATAEAAAPASDEGMLSAGELEALGLGLETPAVDTSLKIYGFGDFTVATPIKPRGLSAAGLTGAGGRHTSFFVGNVNLYVSKNLSESFRSMMEVRFTYLPNGTINLEDLQAAKLAYGSTEVTDYADSGHYERWGGIIMQRFYLEWMLHPLITVRAGQFLSPYGIWNVDHGSPTYVPVQRPYAIGNNWIPQRQTGFELYGRVDANNEVRVGYHLTLSNGTGPISEYKDLDDNKAIGARLFLEYQGAAYLRVGASGYYGRDTSSVPSLGVENGKLVAGTEVLSQHDALAIAADVQLKFKGLLVQSEWVSQQRKYTKNGRPPVQTLGAAGYAPDSLSWAIYGLAGYQLPWWALMPYVMGQYDNELNPVASSRSKIWLLHLGLNLHPIDAVTFKIEYMRAHPLTGPAQETYQVLQLQAAWAF